MDVIAKRFPTLAVIILNNLDDQSLVKFKKTNRGNLEFIIQERFYWIRILKKHNEYFETNKESWKKAISKTSTEFIKKLAKTTTSFFKVTSKSFIQMNLQVTPLFVAAYDGDIEFFQQVKEKTFDSDQTPKQPDMSTIIAAAFGGNIALCRQLLQISDNKNHYGKDGITPLHYIAGTNNLEVFKLFHAASEVKNPKMTQSQRTPLHIAAELGYLDTCKFIIGEEDDKNPADSNGVTPLHLAAQDGYTEICCIMIDILTDKNPEATSGITPLHWAAKNGHLEICKLIMKNVIDKNPRDIHDNTPLHYAAAFGQLNVAEFILKNITEKNPSTDVGETPLHWAA